MISADMFIGSMIGEYQIKQLLGQSQLGAAYLALHPGQGSKATVITFPLPEEMSLQEREQLGLRIAQEREMLTRLKHPHILPVYACGMQPGYLYLVAAYAKEASLGQHLKQNGRLTPQQALAILKQLASGLDYAHSQGAVHGMLSLSNVMMSGESNVRIAGFGMFTMLNIYSNAQRGHPLDHLTSKSGAFLGQPGYIAPERVMGRPVEACADIYALGVMLFELLTGTQPFGGSQPLDTAIQRLEGPIPSVHAFCPEAPEAFDLVVSKMLERDPAKRTQQAGDAVASFERILKTLDFKQSAAPIGGGQPMPNAQATIPPTVNWLDEPMTPAQEPAMNTALLSNTSLFSEKTEPAIQTPTQISPGQQMSPVQPGVSPLAGNNPNSLAGVDPFAWWVGTSNGVQAASPVPGKFSQGPSGRLNSGRLYNTRSRSRSKSVQQDRRKLVTLLAAGTVAGVLTVSGVSLARVMQNTKQAQTQTANNPTSGPTTTGGATTTPTAGATPGAQTSATPTAKATATSQPGATPQPTTPGQQPTQPPPPKPTPTPPPSHTGTVIGHTSQASNSEVTFTNPADGKASGLIHLANGNWAACELACTHVGITVNYDPGSQKMVCPAHGAIFDPANGFAYQPGSGPGTFAPLPRVAIRVNGDGTITTG